MGMFDVLIVQSATCVACKTSLSALQTKDGPCVLAAYRLGDQIPGTARFRWLHAYTPCDKCKTWHNFRAYVDKDGCFTRLEYESSEES